MRTLAAAALLLLAAGADSNSEASLGVTPMEEAAEPHQKAVIAVLMAAGADLPKELARLSLDPEVLAKMRAAKEAIKNARKELEAACKEGPQLDPWLCLPAQRTARVGLAAAGRQLAPDACPPEKHLPLCPTISNAILAPRPCQAMIVSCGGRMADRGPR